MQKDPVIDCIVAARKPDASFAAVLDGIEEQTVRPRHIIILNQGERYWKNSFVRGRKGVEVYHVSPSDRGCGTLQNFGAGLTDADFVVFMGQDVVPADDRVFSKMLRPFRNRMVKVSYARQVPDTRSGVVDGYETLMRFPAENHVRREKDIAQYGFGTFFSSNGCAMYEMSYFRESGGFAAPVIRDEDILYAAAAIRRGYAVAYCGGAEVYRNVRRSDRAIFRQAFDRGVAIAEHPELFAGIRTADMREEYEDTLSLMRSAGMDSYISRFRMRRQLYLRGISLGKRYRMLPRRTLRSLSGNGSYFDNRG